MNQLPLIVPESAAWYVRTALDRAIRKSQEDVEQSKKFLTRLDEREKSGTFDSEDKKEYLDEIRESARGMLNYQEQWLREAKQAFAQLPDALRPNME